MVKCCLSIQPGQPIHLIPCTKGINYPMSLTDHCGTATISYCPFKHLKASWQHEKPKFSDYSDYHSLVWHCIYWNNHMVALLPLGMGVKATKNREQLSHFWVNSLASKSKAEMVYPVTCCTDTSWLQHNCSSKLRINKKHWFCSTIELTTGR